MSSDFTYTINLMRKAVSRSTDQARPFFRESTVSVCKVKRQKNYGVVTDAVMLNTALSSDARFLIAMVSVLPPNWQFNIRWLQEKSGWGKYRLQGAMRELEITGHLNRIQHRPRGKGTGSHYSWEYEFYIEPVAQEPNSQSLDHRGIDHRGIENQSLLTYNSITLPAEKKTSPGRSRAQSTTTTSEQGGGGAGADAARTASQLKPPVTDSQCVLAISQWLVDALSAGEDSHYISASPMIKRTARALATRHGHIDTFNAECQSEISYINHSHPTLRDVRELFHLD